MALAWAFRDVVSAFVVVFEVKWFCTLNFVFVLLFVFVFRFCSALRLLCFSTFFSSAGCGIALSCTGGQNIFVPE